MVETSGACEFGHSALSLGAWPCRYTNVRHSMGAVNGVFASERDFGSFPILLKRRESLSSSGF